MSLRNKILSHIKITQNQVISNGDLVLEDENILKAAYNLLGANYPKFHKMDGLCQLGFLGVEFLKKTNPILKHINDRELALVLQNQYGSSYSDIEHQKNVNKQSPSPANFVYTLPNIVIGEIAIRNKWYGESMFFVNKEKNWDNILEYSELLMETNKANYIIAGNVEYVKDFMELKLVLVGKENIGIGDDYCAEKLEATFK